MSRFIKLGVVVALILTAVGSTAWVSAEDGGRQRGQRGGRLRARAKELDLTDEQKAEIREIVKSHAEEIKAAKEAVEAKRQALRDLVRADKVDESAIRKAADELGTAIGNGAVLRAKVRAEIREVLTEEQRAKADEMQAEPRKRGEGRKKGEGRKNGEGRKKGEGRKNGEQKRRAPGV